MRQSESVGVCVMNRLLFKVNCYTMVKHDADLGGAGIFTRYLVGAERDSVAALTAAAARSHQSQRGHAAQVSKSSASVSELNRTRKD